MENKELIALALSARKKAYTPYSHFAVGAALLGKNKVVYSGCNIESASYSPTNCAERTAFFKAVSEGCRDFSAIAIVGGPEDETELIQFAYPCGVCRQVMMEFCNPATFKILVAKSPDNYQEYTLAELLPEGFGPADLGK